MGSWSYVRSSEVASVVPLRHDEYEKFIMGSWPYYASTLSVSAAFMIFCTIWLAIGDEDKKGKKKAE
jgi:oligosaccharyltransferase complex subunit beta